MMPWSAVPGGGGNSEEKKDEQIGRRSCFWFTTVTGGPAVDDGLKIENTFHRRDVEGEAMGEEKHEEQELNKLHNFFLRRNERISQSRRSRSGFFLMDETYVTYGHKFCCVYRDVPGKPQNKNYAFIFCWKIGIHLLASESPQLSRKLSKQREGPENQRKWQFYIHETPARVVLAGGEAFHIQFESH